MREGKARRPPELRETMTTPQLEDDGGVFLFAVAIDYDVRVGEDSGPRIRDMASPIKHETLFHNAEVRAAGEIQFKDGIIIDLNDHSGSYGTRNALDLDPRFSADVLLAIERAGALLGAEIRRRLTDRAEGLGE